MAVRLATPEEFTAHFADLDLPVIVAGRDDPLDDLWSVLDGKLNALIGHSGVGKGRHTSTQSVALPLPDGRGWVVDTPGIRSFGLAHVTPDQIVDASDDLRDAIESCPRGCTHLGPSDEPPVEAEP